MNDRKRELATIRDVARLAAVSVGTVSRVINEGLGVKPATRQRVLNAIGELHYSPNLIARSMTSKRTGSLGVIVPFFTRHFFMEVLQGVDKAITQAKQEIILYNVHSNEECESYFSHLPRQGKVDGLLIISLYPDDVAVAGFRHVGFPVVLIDAYHPLLTSLVVNNVEGGYQAVKCLIEHGHRHIGFVSGVPEGDFRFNASNDRFVGLHRALGEAGIQYEPDLVVTAEWDRKGGKEAALQLLNRPDRPTAIFAASDAQAVGVLDAAKSLNISVPAQLSVIGFDGIELSEILELSTIMQPMQHMGELGVQKLIAQINDPSSMWAEPELIRLETSLVQRRTITVPPHRE